MARQSCVDSWVPVPNARPGSITRLIGRVAEPSSRTGGCRSARRRRSRGSSSCSSRPNHQDRRASDRPWDRRTDPRPIRFQELVEELDLICVAREKRFDCDFIALIDFFKTDRPQLPEDLYVALCLNGRDYYLKADELVGVQLAFSRLFGFLRGFRDYPKMSLTFSKRPLLSGSLAPLPKSRRSA